MCMALESISDNSQNLVEHEVIHSLKETSTYRVKVILILHAGANRGAFCDTCNLSTHNH